MPDSYNSYSTLDQKVLFRYSFAMAKASQIIVAIISPLRAAS